MTRYVPPFPEPHKGKLSLLARFFAGKRSWLHTLSVRSYKMRAGKVSQPRGKLYIANDTQQISRILNKEAELFPKHHMLERAMRPLLGGGIFTANGDEWRRQRKMMTAAFANTALKKSYPLMKESAGDMLKRFDALCERTDDEPVLIDTEMTHVTADIIFRAILSRPLTAEESRRVFEAFNAFQETAMQMMARYSFFMPIRKLEKENRVCAGRIRDVLAPVISERYEAYHNGTGDGYQDILQALLEARDEDTGAAFTAEELTDQVSVFFLAGHETTASVLTWALYIAAARPEHAERMEEEARAAYADAPDGIAPFPALKQLTFTRCFFRETLRLYPPVGFMLRESANYTHIRGHHVKKGATVMVSPWLLHRCSREWDDPHAFRPERFSEQHIKDGAGCAYIPFGSGPRVCIGAGFASQEALMILSALCKRYRFETVPGREPEPSGRVTVRPENGVYLYIKQRSAQ